MVIYMFSLNIMLHIPLILHIDISYFNDIILLIGENMNIKGLIVLKAEAQKYLQETPERFNKEEKEKFLKDLNH